MTPIIYAGLPDNKRYDCNFTFCDLNSCINFISHKTGLSIFDIKKKSRKRDLVFARWCYFYLAKKHLKITFEKIGKSVNVNHATVMHGIKECEKDLFYDFIYWRKEKGINL